MRELYIDWSKAIQNSERFRVIVDLTRKVYNLFQEPVEQRLLGFRMAGEKTVSYKYTNVSSDL